MGQFSLILSWPAFLIFIGCIGFALFYHSWTIFFIGLGIWLVYWFVVYLTRPSK